MSTPTTSAATTASTSLPDAPDRPALPPATRDGADRSAAALSLPVPWLGTIALSRAQLVYVGGIAGLTALGLLEWPIALVIASGSVLTSADCDTVGRDLGGAMAA